MEIRQTFHGLTDPAELQRRAEERFARAVQEIRDRRDEQPPPVFDY